MLLSENFLQNQEPSWVFLFDGIISSHTGMWNCKKFFVFQALQIPSWNIRKFLILLLESSISRIWKKQFVLGSSLLKFYSLRARTCHSLKCKKSFFWENVKNNFQWVFLRKTYKNFVGEKLWRLRLKTMKKFWFRRLERSIFRNIRHFFRAGCFYFLRYFLKYKKFFKVSVSWVTNFVQGFHFQKYKKNFLQKI